MENARFLTRAIQSGKMGHGRRRRCFLLRKEEGKRHRDGVDADIGRGSSLTAAPTSPISGRPNPPLQYKREDIEASIHERFFDARKRWPRKRPYLIY